MKGIQRRSVGYCLYGVALTLALLYYRFPSEASRDFISAKISGLRPGIHVSLREVSLSLKFGVEFKGMKIVQETQPPSPVLELERVFIRPAVWSILRGQLEGCFEGSLYDGSVKGCAALKDGSAGEPFSTTVTLEGIRLDPENPIVKVTGRDVQGILGGEVTYRGRPGFLAGGRGEAELRLKAGRIALLRPILGLESIDFNEIRLRATLNDRKIRLANLDLRGQQMHGTLSGQVSLNRDFLRSALDLAGSLEPYSDMFKDLKTSQEFMRSIKKQLKGGRLPFVIKGTIGEPVIRFL
ncbi:MAG: type II secretion system protein GspN [Deltaproteobacteria bacterium]|nr:type II secretion system protein GspN [Deltaproteobacteria bacterium]MBW2065378.1 type II secretion system protein GspN [Deltaproteobacteria bacterium]